MPSWARVACGLSPSSSSCQVPLSPGQYFPTHKRPALEDIAGVMELFYVRSASLGWLCRDWRKNGGAGLCWGENFALAVSFPDLPSALQGCEHWQLDDVSMFKACSVFVEVRTPKVAAKVPDLTRDTVKAACEAREIPADIEKGARERWEAVGKAPKGHSPRL